MERALVAQRVANELFATEAAIDEALIRATKLMGDMIAARKELGVSAVVGDEAITSINQTITGLTAARNATVLGHQKLEEAKLRIGIRTKMTGIAPKNSAEMPPEADATVMRRVG